MPRENRFRSPAAPISAAAVLIGCLLLFATPPAAAQQDGQQVSFNLGRVILSVAVGDLTGDSVDDVAVVVSAPLEILVFETQGYCSSPTVHAFPAPSGSVDIFIAELNGDGFGDLVVTRPQMLGGVSVLTSTGSTPISFTTNNYFMNGPATGSTAFQIADHDGDGDLDLLSRFEVLNNVAGSGLFAPAAILPGFGISTSQQTLVWADVDGNGQADLIVSDLDPAGVLRTHRAEFQSAISTFGAVTTTLGPTLTAPTASLALQSQRCDINLDGFDDILIQVGNASSQQRWVSLGSATQALQTFVTAPDSQTLNTIKDPVGFDLDGDGQGELFSVVVDPGSSSAPDTNPFNFGAGGFTPSAASYPAIGHFYDVGDFNQDGFGDFAFIDGPLLSATTLTIAFGGSTPIWSLTQVGGPTSLTYADGSTSPTFTIELRDCFGATLAGVPITLSGLPSTVSILGPTPLITDVVGRVSFQLSFPPLGGPDFDLVLLGAVSNSVSLNFTRIQPTLIDILDAPEDFVMLGRPETIRVRLRDAQTGQVLAGEPLTLLPDTGLSVPSGLTPLTDAMGIAEFDVVTQDIGASFGLEIALAADPSISERVEFFGRGLEIPILPNGVAIVRYRHETIGVPFLLAADLPLPSPGFLVTPYGDIYTSVLAPTPGLATLMATTGPQFFVSPPSGIAGLTFNVQIYGSDPNYVFPDSVFISNPVTLTF